eukprot:TRINITY_DN19435_c0_g2_i1.p1 TRINITY_DN19435_c0_g2~~TRINITY_DN19435_c0_g2_i1.p1  ORF type:complete len:562 (+),score=143.29 TRINITY_DN19435_c0_g2_i1:40-1725(+)
MVAADVDVAAERHPRRRRGGHGRSRKGATGSQAAGPWEAPAEKGGGGVRYGGYGACESDGAVEIDAPVVASYAACNALDDDVVAAVTAVVVASTAPAKAAALPAAVAPTVAHEPAPEPEISPGSALASLQEPSLAPAEAAPVAASAPNAALAASAIAPLVSAPVAEASASAPVTKTLPPTAAPAPNAAANDSFEAAPATDNVKDAIVEEFLMEKEAEVKQAPWQAEMEQRLGEALRDELHEKGVSQEVMTELAEREREFLEIFQRRLEDRESEEEPTINHHLRSVAMQLMGTLFSSYGLEVRIFYEAALIFDAFLSTTRGKAELSPESLPNICFAIVRLLDKLDNCRFPRTVTLGLDPVVAACQAFSARLPGCFLGRVTEQQVTSQERAVLNAISWDLPKSSTYSWLSSMGNRMMIISRGAFAPSLAWVWRWTTMWAHTLTLNLPVSSASAAALAPVRVARGLFCIGLILAGVSPPRIFKHAEEDDAAWVERLRSFSPTGSNTMISNDNFPEGHWQSLLEVVQVAAHCDEHRLRRDTRCVAMQITEAMSAGAKAFEGPAVN